MDRDLKRIFKENIDDIVWAGTLPVLLNWRGKGRECDGWSPKV